jgi:uncharacterized protein YcfJ
MKSMNKKLLGAGIVVVALAASTAFATVYFAQPSEPSIKQHTKVPAKKHTQVASAAPAQPPCNDHNVLGYVAGGAAGGIVGNQVGKGNGNTAATIAGTLGGAYLGGQHIPLNNVTCR